jgi:hypothetical protein
VSTTVRGDRDGSGSKGAAVAGRPPLGGTLRPKGIPAVLETTDIAAATPLPGRRLHQFPNRGHSSTVERRTGHGAPDVAPESAAHHAAAVRSTAVFDRSDCSIWPSGLLGGPIVC